MYYLYSLGAFVGGTIILSLIFGKAKNIKFMNILFALAIFCTYVAKVVLVYIEVGLHDSKFLNTLPTANLEPFIFFISPICLILPKSVKKHFLLLISLLSLGMIVQPAYSCIHYAMIDYKFSSIVLLDYVPHFVSILWGIYIVRSKQVEVKFKNFLSSLSTMLCIIIVITTLNSIFDTSFFGLSLSGKHNIYGYVLTTNSYLSLIIYVGGLVALMFFGYAFCLLIKRKR